MAFSAIITGMPETDIQPAPLTLGDILRQLAMPFFLFAAVLLGLLLLSWVLLLPMLTRVEVDGEARSAVDLQVLKADLLSRVETLESSRDEFVLPLQEVVPPSLVTEKEMQASFPSLRESILQSALRLVPGQRDAVAIQSFRYDARENAIELTGAVRNVGPRSMTVLAQFVEELASLPSVSAIEKPRFVREEDDDGTFFSPFVIRLILR